jgi:hypothetical protein
VTSGGTRLAGPCFRDGVAGECVALLFDVYNHWSRELPTRLASRTTHTTTFRGYSACDPGYLDDKSILTRKG